METTVVRHRSEGGVEIEAEVRGDGPAILLLHGYPESRAMWDEVAPVLAAAGRTVVAADLRGYGSSAKPAPGPGPRRRDLRQARDGGRPARADGLARLRPLRRGRPRPRRARRPPARARPPGRGAQPRRDGRRPDAAHVRARRPRDGRDVLPLVLPRARERAAGAADRGGAGGLAAQPLRGPQRRRRDADRARALRRLRALVRDQEAIAATCADYRAAATVDLDADRADRDAGRTIAAPLLAIWGSDSYVGRSFDVVATWQPYAARPVEGAADPRRPLHRGGAPGRDRGGARPLPRRSTRPERRERHARRDAPRGAARPPAERRRPRGCARSSSTRRRPASGRGSPPALAAIRAWVEPALGRTGELVTVDGVDHLLFEPAAEPFVLLLGHVDTVWPLGTIAGWPFTLDDDGAARGPGIFDMKAGLVAAIGALDQVADPSRVALLVSGDEETGSLTSRALVERVAARAEAVLVLEPSEQGALKVARCGASIYRVRFAGRARASPASSPSAAPTRSSSCRVRCSRPAHVGDAAAGTTVTPTVAAAGTVTNTVPARAELMVDVRARTLVELERVDRWFAALAATDPEVDDLDRGRHQPPAAAGGAVARAVRARAGRPPATPASARWRRSPSAAPPTATSPRRSGCRRSTASGRSAAARTRARNGSRSTRSSSAPG